MPHSSIKLTPGFNENATPALNETGFASGNLVRFIYDLAQGALVQKLGGWVQYSGLSTTAIVRALLAWEDTNAQTHLAYATQNAPSTTQAQLNVYPPVNGQSAITPRNTSDSVAVSVSTTSGSNKVTVTDGTVVGITDYDSVYIATQISVGGIVLFGQYACDPDGSLGSGTYTLYVTDILGNPLPATSTVSNGGSVAKFATTTGTSASTVTVTLNNHGYSVGSTFPVLVSTTVGGVTFYGQYLVQAVIDANNFTITAPTTPTSATSGYMNGGNAYYIYNFGVGSIPSGTGYGIGTYGGGGYGTGTAVTPSTGTPISATDWTLDNWGEVLLACPINASAPSYQPIYAWDPLSGSPTATVIPNAPPVNDGFFVAMPQRQIIAWGSTFTGIQDPLLIRWCDVNNYNTWIGQITNQAGSYRIPRGSKIVGCIQGPQQGLIWTDVGLWSMQYIGTPYVYSFNELGYGCGLIARKAAGSLNGVVYWMGPTQFYALSGNGISSIACPVWDVIFQDLDQSNLQKIRVAVNSRFSEIMWFYPTMSDGGEVNAYVKYNTSLNVWDYGTMGRSAWIDQSVLGAPIGADATPTGSSYLIYQHETSNDANGQPLVATFTTGYSSIAEGDLLTYVDQVWPDMKWGDYGSTQQTATINLTFNVANYPGDTPVAYGPYSLTQNTQYISPRFRGRLVSVTLNSSDIGSFWRLGNIRYRYSPDGKF